MKNKILFWLLSIFILLNIVDTITTMFIIKGESNPLFHLFGGNIYIVILLKIIIILLFIWEYKLNVYSNKYLYFITIMILTYGSAALLFAQISNIYAILNPIVLEQAIQQSTEVKIKGYFNFISILYFIPMLFTLLNFWLYDKSISKINIDKDFEKKKGWWKNWE